MQTVNQNSKNDISYAYIKNGDVIEQFEKILASMDNKITSGPDAFIYDFVKSVQNNPLILLSRTIRDVPHYKKDANIKAKVFKMRGAHYSKIWLGPISTIQIFLQLMQFKPKRILCGTTGGPLWACFLASKIYSSAFVHSRHNRVTSNFDSWYRKLSILVDNWCIRRACGAVCHGPYLKQELLDAGVNKDRIFEFDVSFDDMLTDIKKNSFPHQYASLAKARFLLYFGRVQENKGVFDLLSAYMSLSKKDRSLMLVYAGTGIHLERLKKTVLHADLENKVLLLGKVPHDQLAYIIKASLAVITPTRSEFPEGRCMSAMESLIMQTPVIAPDFGPFPYLVKHGENGLLYAPDSIEDLEYKLEDLLSNEDLIQKLISGAKKSGEQLMNPIASFSQALKKAFALKSI